MSSIPPPPSDEEGLDEEEEEEGFRFSVSKLPSWAQRTVYSRPSIAATVGVETRKGGEGVTVPPPPPGGNTVAGRWAEVYVFIISIIN